MTDTPRKFPAGGWKPAQTIAHRIKDHDLRGWLLDPASLTHRLQQICENDPFHVELLFQGWSRPSADEQRALKLAARFGCLMREVRLYRGRLPLVFARTAIPATTLRGSGRRLAHLGNKPLGAFLFANPNLQRTRFELRCFAKGSPAFSLITCGMRNPPQEVWGRRSVFLYDDKPLLVAEIFLRTPGKPELRHPFSPINASTI